VIPAKFGLFRTNRFDAIAIFENITDEKIHQALAMLSAAKKPIFFIGGGMNLSSGACDRFLKLAEKSGICVTSSLMGLGAFPGAHPQFIGMVGMHGLYAANMALSNADLIFSIGVRFDDRVTGALGTFAQHADIIHIDIDPSSIARNVAVQLEIVGDASHVLEKINAQFPANWDKKNIQTWNTQIQQWSKDKPLIVTKGDKLLSPVQVIKHISDVFHDAIVVTDVGQHQMWTAQFFNFSKPRTLITSGGLGTMGFGLPASMGVKLGNPTRDVICITGDGSFQMLSNELATIAQNNLAVKIFMLNNQYLGMVRQWQEMFFNKNYAATCLRKLVNCTENCHYPGEKCPPYIPDFIKLVDAYSIQGHRVTEADAVLPLLQEIKQIKDRPVFVEFMTEHEENVFPIVPEGEAIYNMITEDGGKL